MAKGSHTFGVASLSEHLAVHVLSRRHRALAELFGGQTGHQLNKFHRCSWRAGPQGMPMLDDAIAWFVGRIVSRFDVGDHVAYMLDPSPRGRRSPPTRIRCTCPIVDDIDDDDDSGGTLDPTFFRGAIPLDVPRRYGLRFTIDGT